MSQYFDMGEETLWNPSNGPSRLFLRQVALFEEELGLPSGMGPMENDECQIDPSTFETFVNALVERHRRTHHPIVSALSENFTAMALVLAQRAGIQVNWTSSAPPDTADIQVPARTDASVQLDGEARAARLREKAHDLSRFMAR
ncbi:DUF6086 family protein [Actinomadura viridis]|uniref:Uncharacterized protein n=1 Tax=Actinomadura viridis TaxID=58110 RepID=A0A931GKZ9_9ACTN|nr:DUF6086 family protein [Actinomadura viridis]MBG6091458.1 hypothetical protein [Actinomadura viridis]